MKKHIVKIVLDGRGGSGKTSMLNYLTKGYYIPAQITIGMDFRLKEYEIVGRQVISQIWDFGGVKRFDFFRSSYYRGASAVILVCDVTRYNTYDDLEFFMDITRKEGLTPDQIILIGAKSDLTDRRTVEPSNLIEFGMANQLAAVIETSARMGHNVEVAFELATCLALYKSGHLSLEEYEMCKEDLQEAVLDLLPEPLGDDPVKKCYKCNRVLRFHELIGANAEADIQQLRDLWESPYIQFYCCYCYKELQEQGLFKN